MSNDPLKASFRRHSDEFYTQYRDVEAELRYYIEHFKNAVVYCNCDDYRRSNFWKFFHLNFSELRLKKLIATSYSADGPSYRAEYTGGNDSETAAGAIIPMAGNGDFRSPECVELLKEADIVVSNPPFKSFSDYICLLMENKRRFLVLGNMNAVTYKDIFHYIKDNELWIGVNAKGGTRVGNSLWFLVPDDYKGKTVIQDGQRTAEVSAWWFTNLDHPKRHVPIQLKYRYSRKAYPTFDDFDAINVDRTKKIPKNYSGIMAVPIPFLSKYCPEQFEILDINPRFYPMDGWLDKPVQLTLRNAGRKDPYARILIMKK